MSSHTYPFLDSSKPLEERILDLLGRLTPEEKASQLRYESPGIERLGIAPYNWWNECLHGVARNGVATVFPQAIGLAATWDVELIEQVATAISDEARAKHQEAARAGSFQQYQGLTFWTPNINIFRDPRWGRGQETWGEDPFLTGELGAAFVRGLQGDEPEKHLKTAACAKHYAVHSGPEEQRHTFNAKPPKQDFRETYLPAFQRLVDEGVEAVMGAYNRIYDEPCCGSPLLLRDILREEWGFKGHVVSDCWAIQDFHLNHKVTKTREDSAALALKNGCDLNCGSVYCDALNDAHRLGLITEEDLDRALARLLRARFRLGMFDPPEKSPWSDLSTEIVRCPEHVALSREAARKSIVLLKNNGVLPFTGQEKALSVMGPNAADVEVLLGNYHGISPRLVTLLEGVAAALHEGQRVDFRPAIPLDFEKANPLDWAGGDAERMDVVIMGMGIHPRIEGEEGDALHSATYGDRTEIELPKPQRDYLVQLREKLDRKGAATKIVVVLFGGAAIACPEVHDLADAVLQVWYPGETGGDAIADVLFGFTNPSGKMPVTVPRATADLPPYEDYSMNGRTYRFLEKPCLYPFGFGLSYTSFAIEKFELKKTEIPAGDDLHATVRIKNTGDRAGDEVIQLYLQWHEAPVRTPRYQLVGFDRTSVDPGKTAEIQLTVPAKRLLCYDEDGNPLLHPGRYTLHAATATPLPETTTLGAPAGVSVEFELS